jgi:hypothetical protein
MSVQPVCNRPPGCSSVSPTLSVEYITGGVGERLKPAVLKTVRLERVSGVRIPPPPPDFAVCALFTFESKVWRSFIIGQA